MKIGMTDLCLAELRKVRARGLLYAVLAVGFLHGLFTPLVVRGMLAAGEDVVEKMNGGGTWEPMAAMDWLVGVDLTVTSMAYPLFGMVFAFLISVLWAQDFSLGTLGMIVVRPVSRWKLFGAKALVSVAVLTFALGLSIVASVLVSVPLFGMEGATGELANAEACLGEDEVACFPYLAWMAEPSSGVDELAAGTVEFVGKSVAVRILGIAQGLLLTLIQFGPLIALVALLAILTRSPVLTLFGSLFLLVADAVLHFVLLLVGSAGSGGAAELAASLKTITLWSLRGLHGFHGSGELFGAGAGDLIGCLAYTVLLGGLAGYLFSRCDVD